MDTQNSTDRLDPAPGVLTAVGVIALVTAVFAFLMAAADGLSTIAPSIILAVVGVVLVTWALVAGIKLDLVTRPFTARTIRRR